MMRINFLLILILLSLSNNSIAEMTDCDEFKRLSVKYMKCKSNLIKEKSISTGQNIIKDTIDYQDKEWSDEKKKIEKAKKKVNEVKKKVLEK